MIISTKGILFNYFKYSDNSLIIEFFTADRGKESFLISIKKFPKNFFKLLSVYDLEIIIKDNRNIQKIKNLSLIYNFNFYFNHIKSCIIIFISEFLNKILPKNQPDSNLFYFIENSIYAFNNLDNGFANFHLSFMLKLTKYLGISIENFLLSELNDSENLEENFHSPILLHLYRIDYDFLDEIKLNKNLRNEILIKIINFYSSYYHNLSNIKSIDVLKEIFY